MSHSELTEGAALELRPDPLLTLPSLLRELADLIERCTCERDEAELDELRDTDQLAIEATTHRLLEQLADADLLGVEAPGQCVGAPTPQSELSALLASYRAIDLQPLTVEA